MNRIDRLTAIIIFLQGRNRVSVAELAERYAISERTVYRDLVALQEAGVPIGSEPGEGYFIVKGYHLPPVMFDKSEAASLLAGERLMQKWHQTELGKSYLSALDKIRSILPPDEKEYFEVLDERIQTFKYQNVNSPKPDERIFGFLQNAIFKKEIIEIGYLAPSQQKETTRKIEPLGLLLMGSHWYLAAWCRLREDYRMFRLDRFATYKSTGIQIRQSTDHSLKEFYERNLREEKELTEVVVWFENEFANYVGEQKYWHGWAWERSVDGGLEITFLTSSVSYLCRWLLMWGNKVTIRKCDEAKKMMREFVDQLHQHHV